MGGKPGKPRFNPTEHSYQYDMIIIGGGPSGIVCAREAAKHGAKVAICDYVSITPTGTQLGFGGTSVNAGSIPTSLMHQASVTKDYLDDAPLFGWKAPEEVTLNWGSLIESIKEAVQSLSGGYKELLESEKITVYQAQATFKSEHEVSLTDFFEGKKRADEVITGQCIVIAVGCRPKYLNKIPGGSEKDNLVVTTDDLFSLPYPPGKTLCVGNDYINTQCAGMLRRLGFEVSTMEKYDPTKVGIDDYIAGVLISINLQDVAQVTGLGGGRIKKITKVKDGSPPTLKVFYSYETDEDEKKDPRELECNTVLLTVGRRPCTNTLNLAAVGVRVDEKGFVIVDKFDCSDNPHIYAIGDCAKGRIPLTPPAVKAGRYLARRIYDKKFSKVVDYAHVPSLVWTPYEYACCGLAQEEATKIYGEDKIQLCCNADLRLPAPEKRRCRGITYGQLVCLKKGKREQVVGFHCLGPHAAEITAGFSMALKKKCFKEDFDDLVWLHPTHAEGFGKLEKAIIYQPSVMALEKVSTA